jgi:hypothetical protein
MDFYATSLDRGLATRDRLDPARFVDVWHDELLDDPIGVVERIHERFDRPLGIGVRVAMETRLTRHPRHRHGVHRYALERYGLAPEMLRERFADYVERFGLVWD